MASGSSSSSHKGKNVNIPIHAPQAQSFDDFLNIQDTTIPTTTTTSDAMSNPIIQGIHQSQNEQEKRPKSDLFTKHMKKVEQPDGTTVVVCNYCGKTYSWSKSGGYGTYRKHIEKQHPTEAEAAKAPSQTQISRYATSSNQLFHYTDANNREELARMVAVEHLSFSFGEKIGFIGYCHKALNPAACRVPRTTLTRALFKIYKKEKKNFG